MKNLFVSLALIIAGPAALADICIVSFTDRIEGADTAGYSCNGSTPVVLPVNGSATSDEYMSRQLTNFLGRGYRLVNCLYYETQTARGRECYFVRD